MLNSVHLRLRDQTGTAVVEMALILPLALLLVIGVLEFGRAFNYWNDVNHLAAEAARYAAVNRSPDGGDLKTYILGRGDTAELRDAAFTDVCISFPNGTSRVGDPVRVMVTFEKEWFSGVLPAAGLSPDLTLKGEAEHRLEVVPTYAAGCSA